MEVHHHSHTARKRWSHYFWEFLMLFLAVFAGFLAENQREHIVEHKRAKNYAANLYRELLQDLSGIDTIRNFNEQLASRFDSLGYWSRVRPAPPTGTLYFYSMYVGDIKYFSPSTSTLAQLKGSGNLRILPQNIALKLSEYDAALHSLQNDYDLFTIEYETLNNLRLKIFDGITVSELFSPHKLAESKRDSLCSLPLELVNDDPKLMKEFIGWVKVEGGFLRSNMTMHLIPLRKKAVELIDMLRKEYHLKEPKQ
jgi:hypothetical protein